MASPCVEALSRSAVEGGTKLRLMRSRGQIWTPRVKLVDLVLLVLIACALVFLFWQLIELARYL
jgi:hypothetical protein